MTNRFQFLPLAVFLLAFLAEPCHAADNRTPRSDFMLCIDLACAVILGAGGAIVGKKFEQHDSYIPAMLGFCGFVIGFVAGITILAILTVLGIIAGIGYTLYRLSPRIYESYHQQKRERAEQLKTQTFPRPADFREKIERDLEDEIEDILTRNYPPDIQKDLIQQAEEAASLRLQKYHDERLKILERDI